MKLKKLLSLVLSSVMLVSATGINAFAVDEAVNEAVDVDNRIAELVAAGHEIIEVDAVPGNVYDIGNGLKCVVMDKKMFEETKKANGDSVSPYTRSIDYVHYYSDLYSFGVSLEYGVRLSAPYSYFRLYFENYQAYNESTLLGVYDTYDNLCSKFVNVPGGYYYYIYSGNWSGDYIVRYNTSTRLDGMTYLFRATSQAEVDYEEFF